MPRKPRFIHTLRRIRQIAGFANQREFADYIGVSAPLLLSIENGRRSLTTELAARIHWLMGCSLGPLLDGPRDAEPRDTGGRPYTRAYFEEHRRDLAYEEERMLRERVRALGYWTWMLLRAARLRDLKGTPNRRVGGRRPRTMLIVAHRLAAGLDDVAKEFGLEEEIEKLLRVHGETMMSPEPEDTQDWKRLLRAANKWRASKGKAPLKMAKFQRRYREPTLMVPAWVPSHDVPREALRRWRSEMRHMADPKTRARRRRQSA